MIGGKCSSDDVLCFEEAGECWSFVRGSDLGRRFDLILQYGVVGGVGGGTHGEVGGGLMDRAQVACAGGR